MDEDYEADPTAEESDEAQSPTNEDDKEEQAPVGDHALAEMLQRDLDEADLLAQFKVGKKRRKGRKGSSSRSGHSKDDESAGPGCDSSWCFMTNSEYSNNSFRSYDNRRMGDEESVEGMGGDEWYNQYIANKAKETQSQSGQEHTDRTMDSTDFEFAGKDKEHDLEDGATDPTMDSTDFDRSVASVEDNENEPKRTLERQDTDSKVLELEAQLRKTMEELSKMKSQLNGFGDTDPAATSEAPKTAGLATVTRDRDSAHAAAAAAAMAALDSADFSLAGDQSIYGGDGQSVSTNFEFSCGQSVRSDYEFSCGGDSSYGGGYSTGATSWSDMNTSRCSGGERMRYTHNKAPPRRMNSSSTIGDQSLDLDFLEALDGYAGTMAEF